MNNQINEVIPFDGQFGKVRAMNINGEAWFVAKDVAEALEYNNPNEAIQDHVDDDDRKCLSFKDNSKMLLSNKFNGLRDALWSNPHDFKDKWLINESGLISLVIGSKLPAARKFKHWITSEVIPSVLKHGVYMTPATLNEMMQHPESWNTMFQTLLAERKAKETALKQIEQDKPKVDFYNAVGCVSGTITLTDMSKLLQNAGIPMGVQKFTLWLITNGYLTQRKLPSQKSLNLGVLAMKEQVYSSNDHGMQCREYARVTGKGQQYFIKKLIDLSDKKKLFEQGEFA